MMTVYGRMLLAAAGSALLLIVALGFQYLGGLAPCPLCLWQRWPHALAVIVGILGVTVLWRQRRWLAVVGTGMMSASIGLGIFHAGVEWGWWEGLSTCSAPSPGAGLSSDELLQQILEAPVVRCDEVPWSMLGLSLAGWNALASLGLAALWAASVVWWRMPFNREA
ncbi:MAG: disulfide bond formation protein B [Pseudomonadota bacterium]